MKRKVVKRNRLINQTYISSVHTPLKWNVKVFRKLYLLQLLFSIIERKKQLLKVLFVKYSSKVSNRKIFAKINKLVLGTVERIFRKIPNSVFNLTKKTRVFKYLKRKNFQLFLSRELILNDLLFILVGRRKKAFSRKTKLTHLFLTKQLIRISNPFAFLKKRSSANSQDVYISNALPLQLVEAGVGYSIWQARQLISHGKIFINGNCVKTLNKNLQIGDAVTSRSIMNSLYKHVEMKRLISQYLVLHFSSLGNVYGRTCVALLDACMSSIKLKCFKSLESNKKKEKYIPDEISSYFKLRLFKQQVRYLHQLLLKEKLWVSETISFENVSNSLLNRIQFWNTQI